ncbi:glycoside hydrolase family 32 protein [Aurantibacter crassamenti]|uniref:glycoside hydrolase family 32 protein n=1 Tax=Aurantibacter crassamenti TaxID=1837375 RepID=UPI0019395602|nr:glycoside hydrolase family 32 protein [Aurantibacter crassamenti]MBM1104704.1 glycoside hydrolase family 32 protein [Aurantibacter crassamenti]
MRNLLIILLISMTFFACKEQQKKVETVVSNDLVDSLYYNEPYRSQYHFTPEEKWMNDPNGMVYHNGIYHLFYQYYPEDIVWGPMHWGHATSKDLIHWQHKPIALYPDELGLIFSGGAVLDKQNTSGFGSLENPPLVAIYTYHLMEGEKAGRKDFQTQGIAYSLDNGDSWVKYEGNPVIGNTDIKDFRDPKVMWHEPSKNWVLTLVAGDHAQFYSSKDLKSWSLTGKFGKEIGAHGGVWECPDLFKLKVGDTEEEKWVLLISINPGAPNGGSGTQYFIGDFDGKTFTTNQKDIKWIDWGTDNYAGVTYDNEPNDERIFIGWMSNWTYARDTPTEKWRSAMTLPRTLSLSKIDGAYTLLNYPIDNLQNIISEGETKDISIASNGNEILNFKDLNQSEIRFKTKAKNFQLSLSNSLKEEVILTVSDDENMVTLNRVNSGKTEFQEDFGSIQKMPINELPEDAYEVRILVDQSSIEIFINEGQHVMTAQLFPNEPYNSLILENLSEDELLFNDFGLNKVSRIW